MRDSGAATIIEEGQVTEQLELETAGHRIETHHPHGAVAWRSWGAGTPVVLMHGSFGSWTHWIRNIPALAEGYQVVAVDLPGMGDSDSPPTPFDPASLGKILADGLDELLGRDTRFHLVGFSFGGILGGQVVLHKEACVRSFTVIGSTALGLAVELPSLLRPEQGMDDAALREMHRENLRLMMIRDSARIDELAIDIQVENTGRARIRSGRIPHGDSLARALRAMRVPVYGIWGALDVTVGPRLDERAALFHSLPHCPAFTSVEGAGHWVAYERPEIVNRRLLEIFDD